jgi:formylglycine-generating enzyme required for sulfatase activity
MNKHMKTRTTKPVRFLPTLSLTLLAVTLSASAQTRPTLGLQFSAGQPTLTLTGAVGTVYSIQYVTGLSPTNVWVDGTLVQAQAGGTVWTDPSAPMPGKRFYRAVSVAVLADTNLVFIPPGAFQMGSPTSEPLRASDETQHGVTLSRGFWMGKYLVTQADYLAVVGSNPSSFPSAKGPVETVSWYDATNYCALRTAQERAARLIPTNYVYRLPTESEWEYAARAGTTTAYYLGCDLLSGQENFDGHFQYDCTVGQIYNANGSAIGSTTPVGIFDANPWGLWDMIGNVWEWCQDWYGLYPSGNVTDPQGAATGSFRVVRGGNWQSQGQMCRSAQRNGGYAPETAQNGIGFRAVLAQGQ